MRLFRLLGWFALVGALSLAVAAAACGDDDDDDIGDIVGTVGSGIEDRAEDAATAVSEDDDGDPFQFVGDQLDDIRDEIVEEITELTEDEITGVEIRGDTAVLATTLTDEAVARQVCEETLGLDILPATEVIVQDASGAELARCS